MDGRTTDRAPTGVPPAYGAVVDSLLDSALLYDETGAFVHDNRAALAHLAGLDPTQRLARELNMRCVAEGVEDEAAHEVAVRLGADRGQGYLYGRPVPASQLQALLTPL